MLGGKCGRRFRSASSGKLHILPPSYCWSELPEGCSGSCPGVGVGRAPLSCVEPMEMGFSLGESALGLLPHTLALLELMADHMRAPVCSLERWHYFNVGANRPTFHPKLAPRTRAIPLGKAAKCAFLAPRSTGCHLLWASEGQGPGWCVYLFPGTGKVFHTDLSWQRCLLKWVREASSQCAPNRRERGGGQGPSTARLLLRSIQTSGSQLWVCGRRIQWLGACVLK